MLISQRGGLVLLQFPHLAAHPGLVHAISTRAGGQSPPPFASLNMSFAVGDDPARVAANRSMLCQALNIPPEALTQPRQVHGNRVAVVTDKGGPFLKKGGPSADGWALGPADAVVTMARGRYLLITIADCLAVMLFDPVVGAVGLAHAGWRGTVAGIAQRTLATMADAFGCRPAEVLVGLGPAIGLCCYAVGPEVQALVRGAFPHSEDLLTPGPNSQIHFDLTEANRRQLVAAGARPENIAAAGMCTACDGERFFSHRGQGGRTGRCAAVIGLRP